MARLHGITWAHPRGIDPVVAAARAWADEPGAPDIVWEARPLAAFEDASLADLAERYDVIAIDHPHLGIAAAEGALAPVPAALDPDRDGSGDAYQGLSLESYRHEGVLLALPADAATMVTATADPAGRLATWAEVLEAALRSPAGDVVLPANPTHLLMTVLAITDAIAPGEPRQTDGRPAWWTETIDLDRLTVAITIACELVSLLPEWCLDADPIRVLDAVATPGGPVHVPLIYGYAPYSRPSGGKRTVHFRDAPGGAEATAGTVLGGVGFAASARRGDPSEALDVVRRLAGGRLQCGLIPDAGGQPAHRAAAADPRIDADYAHFYSRTQQTMQRSFLRPRTPGYPSFQRAAADALHASVVAGRPATHSARLVSDEWEARAS